MSTNVIHPGASSQKAPSGKTIGMLAVGLAAAIALGFAFYLNQSQDVTVSGVEPAVGAEVTDSWLIQSQSNSVTPVTDSWLMGSQRAGQAAAAAEAARAQAMVDINAARYQAQIEAQSEAFGLGQPTAATVAASRAQALVERYEAAYAESLAAQELGDLIQSQSAQASGGSGVNPAFGHEFGPPSGSNENGSTIRVPAR